jgi:hypothetical protein
MWLGFLAFGDSEMTHHIIRHIRHKRFYKIYKKISLWFFVGLPD